MKKSYWNYFFTYETGIPDGIGFGLFTPWHFLWLFGIFTGCFLYLWKYKRSSIGNQRKMEYFAAFSMVVWLVLRAVYIAVIGEKFLYELPLHLCSMAGILCALHCVFQWEWLGQVLYTLCLPGSILALLFPDWNFYPAVHFITVEAFLFHMGIVLYVICLLYSHKIVPKPGKLWQVVLFLAAVVTPVYFFDRNFDVNYMFVNGPSPGSPLEWLSDFLGNPGYLLGYAVLILLCIFLMDLGYLFISSKRGA